MSIQDKIRDELYGSPADELKSEQEAAAYEELLDDNENPWLAAKDLFFYALIEAAILALVIFAPRTAARWMGVGQALPYLILIIFGAGFLLSFRTYKLLRTTVFKKDQPTNDVIAAAYPRTSPGKANSPTGW